MNGIVTGANAAKAVLPDAIPNRQRHAPAAARISRTGFPTLLLHEGVIFFAGGITSTGVVATTVVAGGVAGGVVTAVGGATAAVAVAGVVVAGVGVGVTTGGMIGGGVAIAATCTPHTGQ